MLWAHPLTIWGCCALAQEMGKNYFLFSKIERSIKKAVFRGPDFKKFMKFWSGSDLSQFIHFSLRNLNFRTQLEVGYNNRHNFPDQWPKIQHFRCSVQLTKKKTSILPILSEIWILGQDIGDGSKTWVDIRNQRLKTPLLQYFVWYCSHLKIQSWWILPAPILGEKKVAYLIRN